MYTKEERLKRIVELREELVYLNNEVSNNLEDGEKQYIFNLLLATWDYIDFLSLSNSTND